MIILYALVSTCAPEWVWLSQALNACAYEGVCVCDDPYWQAKRLNVLEAVVFAKVFFWKWFSLGNFPKLSLEVVFAGSFMKVVVWK